MDGSGTEGDPYQIVTLADLQSVGSGLSAHYILMNDIDASDTVNWNGGAGFIPLGDSTTEFTGTFDGQGHIIDGLYINTPSLSNIGLIGYCSVSSAIIKNIGLINVDITGYNYVGALGGYCRATTTNCYTSGIVNGNMAVGGFVGRNYIGSISNCYSTCTVYGTYNTAGFAGYNYKGTFVNCYSTGAVNGVNSAGFVHYTNLGSATNCFWDTQTSGQVTSALGTGKTTAEMQTESTFTSWDFTDTWYMDGYPELQYFYVGTPIPIKVWDGSAWTSVNNVKVWDGSSWTVVVSVKVWDGSVWV